jgi:hypothetical protein
MEHAPLAEALDAGRIEELVPHRLDRVGLAKTRRPEFQPATGLLDDRFARDFFNPPPPLPFRIDDAVTMIARGTSLL